MPFPLNPNPAFLLVSVLCAASLGGWESTEGCGKGKVDAHYILLLFEGGSDTVEMRCITLSSQLLY